MFRLFLSFLVLIFFGTNFTQEAHSALADSFSCGLVLETIVIVFNREGLVSSSLELPPDILKTLQELKQWEILSHPSLVADTLLENQGMWQIHVIRVDTHSTNPSLRSIIFEIKSIFGNSVKSTQYQVTVPTQDWSSAHYEELTNDPSFSTKPKAHAHHWRSVDTF